MSGTQVLKSSGSGLRPKKPGALWGHRLVELVRGRGLLVPIAPTHSSAVGVVGGVTGWIVGRTRLSFLWQDQQTHSRVSNWAGPQHQWSHESGKGCCLPHHSTTWVSSILHLPRSTRTTPCTNHRDLHSDNCAMSHCLDKPTPIHLSWDVINLCSAQSESPCMHKSLTPLTMRPQFLSLFYVDSDTAPSTSRSQALYAGRPSPMLPSGHFIGSSLTAWELVLHGVRSSSFPLLTGLPML